MVDRAVATTGLGLAGATAVAALLAWPIAAGGVTVAGGLTVGGAGIAALAFSAARHDLQSGDVVTAAASLGAVLAIGGAGMGLVDQDPVTPTGQPAALAALAGAVGTLLVATAIARQVPARTLFRTTRLVAIGGAIGSIGLYVAGTTAMLAVHLPGVVTDLDPLTTFAFRQVGVGIGFLLTAGGFVVLSGRGLEYLDVEWIERREAVHILAGIVAILVVGALVAVVYWFLDVPTTEHALHRRGREEGAEFILLAIPFTWIGAVVGEELLYRNVIQKYLTERLSATVAIAASSGIFALVHVPAYSPAPAVSIGAAVLAVFSISLVLAVTYHRTRNVVVPMVIHGCYNVIVYVGIYLQLTGVL